MKKIIKLLLVLSMFIGYIPKQEVHANEEEKSIKILSIGNSFSVDCQEYLYQVLEDLGYTDIKLGNLYIGGCSIDTHYQNIVNRSKSYTYYTNTTGTWTNVKSDSVSAIESEDWDIITLQQASTYSGLSDSYGNLDNLINEVRKYNTTAKLAWNMTWAYQQDSTQSGFKNYNNDQMTMYNAIVNTVQEEILKNEKIDFVIPTGTTIQNLRTSFIGDTLTRDGYHLSYDYGRYVGALTFAAKITGMELSNVKYMPNNVNEDEKNIAIKAVQAALSNPYQITNLETTIDLDKYIEFDYEVTPHAFWHSSYAEGNYHELFKDKSNSMYFFGTQIFTKDMLPNGSIIVLKSGWKYRPEGWMNQQVTPTDKRPQNVTQNMVVIDDAWWQDFDERAFNISKSKNNVDISNMSIDEIKDVFKIYIPKTEKHLSMKYDDHIDISGKVVEILDAGTPTSYQVGTTNLDTSVVTIDGNYLIATGIGSATIKIDGTAYKITVTKAPISLFMITGHSIGAGQAGNKDESVVGEKGQVYSSHGTGNLSSTTKGVGISYAASKKANNITAFNEEGAGTIGEGSALAWKWNQLTNEKVWVLNTAVGGSCLYNWIPGMTNYKNAVNQFKRAQAILKNEIDAGHYELKNMGLFYHSGANFAYKNVEYTQSDLDTWYQQMWNGFKSECSIDMDNDGNKDTFDFLGFLPIWSNNDKTTYSQDRPANMWMATNKEYEDIFLVSMSSFNWRTTEDIKNYFPEIIYTTQNHKALTMPTSASQIYSSDNVHFKQIGYNAIGIDIANNLYSYLYDKQELKEFKFMYVDGKTEVQDTLGISYETETMLIPIADPIVIDDLSFTITGPFELIYPCTIKAINNGNGKLTVSRNNEIIKELILTCIDAPKFIEYEGKVISIMGDSISTFEGYIPVADGFNETHRTRYPDLNRIPDVTDVNQTWWMQAINELDAKLGVNESWAGSCIYWGDNMSTKNGDTGEKAAMASLTRIQNLGSNGTPDVIFLYGGGNDKAKGVKVGVFDENNVPSAVDLVSTKWDSFVDSSIAAIMRMQYCYPNAQIVVLMSNNNTENEYIRQMRKICDYFDISFLFLNEHGLKPNMHPDGSHPNDEGMDVITQAILNELSKEEVLNVKENTVYSITHNLTNVSASKSYYKGVSAGTLFEETLSGENLNVSITMNGKDITLDAYKDGKVTIEEVTGEIVITSSGLYNCDGHLQQLPENICAGTNIWTTLKPENIYYTVNGWGLFSNSPNVHSVTFNVNEGEKVWATSFGVTSGGTGTRITWFNETGVLKSVPREEVYAEFKQNGYITAPEGATAVNIPMGSNDSKFEIYILNREHTYTSEIVHTNCGSQYTLFTCEICGHNYKDNFIEGNKHTFINYVSNHDALPNQDGTKTAKCENCDETNTIVDVGSSSIYDMFEGKVISILSASTSTFAGYIPVADGFNLEHRPRYPQDNLLTDVNETWWMQLIHELDAKLGINDSWAGSTVSNFIDGHSGDVGEKAAMASTTRIQNLGANGTPDIILFFGAGNDMGRGVTLGTFDPATAPTEVDLTATKWDSLADAYVAAILRLKHYYPNTQIVVMTTYAMPSYVTEAKLKKYGPTLKAICDHYDIPTIDLKYSGVTFDDLPDNIHPNANGMDKITDYTLKELANLIKVENGENEVVKITHELKNATASKHYYKGVSKGASFSEMIEGNNVSVQVFMDEKDITSECYSNGKIEIEHVTGDIIIQATGIYDCDGHLQELPDNFCSNTNIWTTLQPENIYYTANGWGIFSNSPNVHSVTFRVNEGDRIWATSFQSAQDKGQDANGTRITWFTDEGVLKTMDRNIVYQEYLTYGYVTVPEGAMAVNIPMSTNDSNHEIYILNKEHSFTNYVSNYDGTKTSKCDYCDETSTIQDDLNLGDIDGNGKVNQLDRLVLSRHLAKWNGYESINPKNADVNLDGKVNQLDRVILSRYLAKWKGYEELPLK